jgi:hypothetical protein
MWLGGLITGEECLIVCGQLVRDNGGIGGMGGIRGEWGKGSRGVEMVHPYYTSILRIVRLDGGPAPESPAGNRPWITENPLW